MTPGNVEAVSIGSDKAFMVCSDTGTSKIFGGLVSFDSELNITVEQSSLQIADSANANCLIDLEYVGSFYVNSKTIHKVFVTYKNSSGYIYGKFIEIDGTTVTIKNALKLTENTVSGNKLRTILLNKEIKNLVANSLTINLAILTNDGKSLDTVQLDAISNSKIGSVTQNQTIISSTVSEFSAVCASHFLKSETGNNYHYFLIVYRKSDSQYVFGTLISINENGSYRQSYDISISGQEYLSSLNISDIQLLSVAGGHFIFIGRLSLNITSCDFDIDESSKSVKNYNSRDLTLQCPSLWNSVSKSIGKLMIGKKLADDGSIMIVVFYNDSSDSTKYNMNHFKYLCRDYVVPMSSFFYDKVGISQSAGDAGDSIDVILPDTDKVGISGTVKAGTYEFNFNKEELAYVSTDATMRTKVVTGQVGNSFYGFEVRIAKTGTKTDSRTFKISLYCHQRFTSDDTNYYSQLTFASGFTTGTNFSFTSSDYHFKKDSENLVLNFDLTFDYLSNL